MFNMLRIRSAQERARVPRDAADWVLGPVSDEVRKADLVADDLRRQTDVIYKQIRAAQAAAKSRPQQQDQPPSNGHGSDDDSAHRIVVADG